MRAVSPGGRSCRARSRQGIRRGAAAPTRGRAARDRDVRRAAQRLRPEAARRLLRQRPKPLHAPVPRRRRVGREDPGRGGLRRVAGHVPLARRADAGPRGHRHDLLPDRSRAARRLAGRLMGARDLGHVLELRAEPQRRRDRARTAFAASSWPRTTWGWARRGSGTRTSRARPRGTASSTSSAPPDGSRGCTPGVSGSRSGSRKVATRRSSRASSPAGTRPSSSSPGSSPRRRART